jgi:5,10-methenyltetrahydrofolate synthetase
MHIRDEKEHLRQAIRERITRIPEHLRHAEGRSLCKQLIRMLPTEPAGIAAFFPVKDEPDLRPLLTEILARGHRLYLPRFEDKRMVFRQVTDLAQLGTGTFGIPEPPRESPLLDPADLSLVFVPGRAFTKSGLRLGRGNGGFDIWIRTQRALNPATRYLGLALDCQIVNDLLFEPHDERMDGVVTARGMLQPA